MLSRNHRSISGIFLQKNAAHDDVLFSLKEQGESHGVQLHFTDNSLPYTLVTGERFPDDLDFDASDGRQPVSP